MYIASQSLIMKNVRHQSESADGVNTRSHSLENLRPTSKQQCRLLMPESVFKE